MCGAIAAQAVPERECGFHERTLLTLVELTSFLLVQI